MQLSRLHLSESQATKHGIRSKYINSVFIFVSVMFVDDALVMSVATMYLCTKFIPGAKKKCALFFGGIFFFSQRCFLFLFFLFSVSFISIFLFVYAFFLFMLDCESLEMPLANGSLSVDF